MRFHPNKCKVLSVSQSRATLLDQLPFTKFYYSLNNIFLDYTDCEKDLGVFINSRMNWSEHCNKIYSKANGKLGLVKNTCHFTKNLNHKRQLYLSLVRSQFEHCSVIWRPMCRSNIDRIESIQKRAVKWIFSELFASYTNEIYIIKCKQLNFLPLEHRFILNDLIFLHKIIYHLIPISLPSYLEFFQGSTRLRHCHLDHLCLVSNICPKTPANLSTVNTRDSFANSFFYRAHLEWNKLPVDIRETESLPLFKSKVKTFIWNSFSPLLLLET